MLGKVTFKNLLGLFGAGSFLDRIIWLGTVWSVHNKELLNYAQQKVFTIIIIIDGHD